MKKCEWCGKDLVGKYSNARFCSKSHAVTHHVTEWRRRTKQKCVELLGGKCQRCGYDRCFAALIFHHPGEKSFGIGSGNIIAWAKIEKELKKCELLCLNCHAEEHNPDLMIV
jgi:hypothetical protein